MWITYLYLLTGVATAMVGTKIFMQIEKSYKRVFIMFLYAAASSVWFLQALKSL